MDWVVFDEVTLTGSDLNPVWPQVNLQADQKEGDPAESYEITFYSDGSNYEYTPSDAGEFSQFNIGSKAVSTAGEVPLKCVTPPNADLTAVVSGDAPSKDAFMPFFHMTVCTGQHYHQSFSISDASQVGETVRIPFGSAEEGFGMCWSADQQYVLYFTNNLRRI